MRNFINLFIFLLAIISMPSLSFAQPLSGGLSSLGGLMPLILIFIFFYLFLLRPQHKKAKKHRDLLNSLKKDDRIITEGGLYATISAVKGNIVEARISDGVYVQIVKQLISGVITKEDEEAAKIPEIVKK
ncbi:MAG: preprotein translocase subunit YajC [Endomicrobium sp.]|jgi:preprotein translocase subunit YajC|nr:preprotein translocase subunit YajC [Endomicrobium sp.]